MKTYQFLEYIISKVKGERYQVSYPFTFYELYIIVLDKLFLVLRGVIFIKPFIRSKGLVFADRGARVAFGKKKNSLWKKISI